MGEGFAQLDGQGDRLIEIRRRVSKERRPVDEFHHDIGMTVDLTGVVDGDDVRMVEPRRQARFLEQPLPVLSRQVGLADHFDRHVAVEQLIMGTVDDGHPASADFWPEAIAIAKESA
jgi:hypothetical protein